MSWPSSEADRRFMNAAIRLSRKHLGLTGTNPSVATLIVRDDGQGPRIVGSGVTARGGRPHAETQALDEAGPLARGATAYVTLEPCAHHGRTPPCAEALVTAGVTRVVGAASDPDHRVSGRGYAILRNAGIEVDEGICRDEAADVMRGYLTRSVKKRPEVTLKLAISADGMIGRQGAGQVAITGDIARRQVHLMRAEADAILVGIGTALADDPELTCRLPGMSHRSPARIILDSKGRLPPSSKLVASAREVAVWSVAGPDADAGRLGALSAAGVDLMGAEIHEGRIALPELLEDISERGVATLLVEGGATVARAFLAEGLVDRICVFQSRMEIGTDGVTAPLDPSALPVGYSLLREQLFGEDHYREFVRSS